MHRFIAALLAVASCASCASIAQAQSADPTSTSPPLTLDQALSLAGATAPSLEAATAGVRAAEAGRTVAGYRPNPSIVAETENIAGSGQYRGLRSAETTAGLALPIELGGKRSARIAVADAIGNRARIGTALAAADLRLAITQLYIEATAAERRLVTAREQAGIAREASRAAGVRVQAGRASPLEQQRADVLRINADTALERAERLAEVARSNLARRISQPLTGPLDLAWFNRVEGFGPARPSETAGTLALAATRADVTTAEAQVRLARSQRIPDVTLSASARRLEATNDVAAVFGVSIPFPLFNNGKAAVAQARAQTDQAQALRRVAELDTAQDIASAQANVANAATTARNASGPALASASEAARIARIGYREGKFGQLDLLDAERTLSETRTAAIDALATYHDAKARLERLVAAAPSPEETNQ
ncbi:MULTISPECIES: TolC family protein [unclassified Sphingomonas]|jgi:cobalt-zinc-cadmium efflux system outer membrane protein|uniref:TolC family protein n=1 Tax=unclassified Sphingomonas TaxID=196159 RepID=UPI0010F77909|nr:MULTISPECIES: TolC family protein [unclassified Sphingomonas]MBD8698495.1 TolC family protein [Sphingomonas sp. CFBP 13714]